MPGVIKLLRLLILALPDALVDDTLLITRQGKYSMEQADLEELSDEKLLELISQGEPEAIEELFLRYYNNLTIAASRSTEDEDAVRDAVVEVFTSLIEGKTTFDPKKGALFSYLLVAVRNRLVDNFRRSSKITVTPKNQITLEQVAAGGNLEQQVLSHLALEELEKALRKLKPIHRRVILLRYLYAYKPAEIGEILGIPASRVSELLYRARIYLRKELQG